MNGKVHYWIVCDAVDYIKKYGNNFEKHALQVLQNNYGKNIPIKDSYYDGAVQSLAGIESWETDRYRDLILGAWWGSETEYDGHVFTALNHFINRFMTSDQSLLWWGNNGYYYWWSSKQDEDAEAMTGWVDWLGISAQPNSLVLPRIKPYWKNGAWSWNANWFDPTEVRNTIFAPVSALASFYYERLLYAHYTPLLVSQGIFMGGQWVVPQKYLAGLKLLGPVLHAIADACVPQHVRPAMGFRHQDWENTVETLAWNWEIDVDANLVSKMLSQKPFTPWYFYDDHKPMKTKFAAGWIVSCIADMTITRLMQSTGKNQPQLWNADKNFWNSYMLSEKFHKDSKYLYNLAVAGAVHAISRAYDDLVSVGVISPNPGLVDSERMPELAFEAELPPLSLKKKPKEAVVVEPYLSGMIYTPKTLLGFAPLGETRLDEQLKSAELLIGAYVAERLEPEKISGVLAGIEGSIMSQYREMEIAEGTRFSPRMAREEVLRDQDLSAHFGTGTFKLPSLEECNNPDMLQQYMNRLDMHVYKSYLFELTWKIAALKFYFQKFREGEPIALQLAQIMAKMEQLRENAINERKIPVTDVGRMGKIDIPEEPPELPEYVQVGTRPRRTEVA